jgi:hypothetical protein|tara:strand:- start:1691 stop:1861 length:171 start_codon:yes stop_codon:yes gene_type:complete
MDEDDKVFMYDDKSSFERNFTRWFMMNCAERHEFGDQIYNQEEGLKVFRQFVCKDN